MTRLTPSEAFVETLAAQAMQMIYCDRFEYLNRPIGLALILGGLANLGLNVTWAIRGP